MTDLTPRQGQILRYLEQTMKARGYPPSMAEIGREVGLASSSSVMHQLDKLQELGYITRDPNRPRSITINTPAGTVTTLADAWEQGHQWCQCLDGPVGARCTNPYLDVAVTG